MPSDNEEQRSQNINTISNDTMKQIEELSANNIPIQLGTFPIDYKLLLQAQAATSGDINQLQERIEKALIRVETAVNEFNNNSTRLSKRMLTLTVTVAILALLTLVWSVLQQFNVFK